MGEILVLGISHHPAAGRIDVLDSSADAPKSAAAGDVSAAGELARGA
jgi:hypothetical protein